MDTQIELKKVIIIGATGTIGSIILSALQSEPGFQITVLTRSPSTTSTLSDVNVVQTIYSEPELIGIFQGHETVISSVGAKGFSEQRGYIDAAIKAGVKRFIPAEYSSNTLSDVVRELVPVFEPKKIILDYLKEKEATGLTWTGLATGPLLDWGITSGFLGFDIANQNANIWDDGNTPFSATNQQDLGRAIVSILRHPVETANRYLYMQSILVSQNQILRSLESATGKVWTVDYAQTDEQISKGRELVSKGDFAGMFLLVQASAWGNVRGIRSNYVLEEELANTILEVPDGSLDQTVRSLTSE